MDRWNPIQSYSWERAPFLRILVPFAGGISLYRMGWCQLPLLPAAALAAFFLLVVYLLFRYRGDKLWFFAACQGLLLFCALAICRVDDVRLRPGWFGSAIDATAIYQVVVTGPARVGDATWKLPVQVAGKLKDEHYTPEHGNALLYVSKNEHYHGNQPGDTLLVPGNWQPIASKGNPYAFDYAAFAHDKGIYYTQACSPFSIVTTGRAQPGKQPLLVRLHAAATAVLQRYLKDDRTRGLAEAMLLGDEVNLDPELRDAYAQTGIIHIIAISGGHLAFFAFIVSGLLCWIRHAKYRWVKMVITLPLAWLYVLLAGAPASAVRAAVMLTVLTIGVIAGKDRNPLNTLLASAFCLLVYQPSWLFSAGFQLSFVAVLSIIIFYPPIHGWWQPRTRIAKAFWGATAASLAAEILVAPLVIYYFHNFPLLFLPANIIAGFTMAVVMMATLMMMACAGVPAVAGALAAGITSLAGIFHTLLGWMQRWSPASFNFLQLSAAELVVLYAALIFAAYAWLRALKPALFASAAATCLLAALLCADEWTALHQCRLVVYSAPLPQADLVSGKHSTALLKPGKTSSMAARTAWHAWREDTTARNEMLLVHGKKVLVLSSYMQAGSSFPVDNLVVNLPGRPDIGKLYTLFKPSVVILPYKLRRRQYDAIANECARLGVRLHSTAHDGAWVLD